MEITYSLRYKKSSFTKNSNIDKEGEIIIYDRGFRIKGKGAGDNGELVSFAEIKEFYHRDNELHFITFAKEKYTLLDAGTQFEQMLTDLYKSRNNFLIDALFMKKGRLQYEIDCDFTRVSKFEKPINSGSATVRFFEKSLVVIPENQDAFAIHYDFIKLHEFSDFEYTLKFVMDDGLSVTLSRLGNDFELIQEKVNTILGMLYGDLVNNVFRTAFPTYRAATLLKLAYKIKNGKTASVKEIRKIDAELVDDMRKFIVNGEETSKKIEYLEKMCDEKNLRYGLAKDPVDSGSFVKWTMFAMPEKNLVAFCVLPRWENANQNDDKATAGGEPKIEVFFFKIIMEKGNPMDKFEEKINEITQSLVVLDFIKDPCYVEKKKLKHSPFQYATRKLPYLRILRRSFLKKASASDLNEFKKEIDAIIDSAAL